MAGRISPIAKPGSLLKDTPKGRVARQGAVLNDRRHLALIRRLPCISCDADPAGTAAHVRMTRTGKPITGAGLKPGDHWTLPLCPTCHTDGVGAQHKIGEQLFYSNLGIDALVLCQKLYAASPVVEAMRVIIFKARETRKWPAPESSANQRG
jgi:hypothetical protein